MSAVGGLRSQTKLLLAPLCLFILFHLSAVNQSLTLAAAQVGPYNFDGARFFDSTTSPSSSSQPNYEVLFCGLCQNYPVASSSYYMFECETTYRNASGWKAGLLKYNCNSDCTSCTSSKNISIGSRIDAAYRNGVLDASTAPSSDSNSAMYAASIQCCGSVVANTRYISDSSCGTDTAAPTDTTPTPSPADVTEETASISSATTSSTSTSNNVFTTYHIAGCVGSSSSSSAAAADSTATNTDNQVIACEGSHDSAPQWSVACSAGETFNTGDRCYSVASCAGTFQLENSPCLKISGREIAGNDYVTVKCHHDRGMKCVTAVRGDLFASAAENTTAKYSWNILNPEAANYEGLTCNGIAAGTYSSGASHISAQLLLYYSCPGFCWNTLLAISFFSLMMVETNF